MKATEPSLGLALGGGAALGWAHVGVLSALEASEVRPDVLAGTSAGALVAALYAFDVPPSRMEELLGWPRWEDVTRVTLSSLGLFSNEAVVAPLEEELGGARVEEAHRPLAVVAADINSGEKVVIREGPLLPALQASACLPGLYVPREIEGRTLVDGGVVDNVPVGVLGRMGADVRVGVTLGERVEFERVRTLVGVLVNAFLMAVHTGARRELERHADVVVRPDLAGFHYWDLEARREIRERGREAGRRAVEPVRRALRRAAGAG